jgi:hypothetical protein
MPAYLINLGRQPGRLELYVENGIYGTSNLESQYWAPPTLYTLADYVTMAPGDLIYFFQSRYIYGIGRIIAVDKDGIEHYVLCNSRRSYLPPQSISPPYLWNGDKDPAIRWRVLFRPSPKFFKQGVDMDEVLQADSGGVARSLRVFENRSFIKMEDDEAHLLGTAILRRNEDNAPAYSDRSAQTHKTIASRRNLNRYLLDIDDLASQDATRGRLAHESTLHVWLADALSRHRAEVVGIFGEWDYVANLYAASPTKPPRYMDYLDIFGYALAPPSPPLPPYVRRYKVVEVKRDVEINRPINVVDQVMKYVDWVSNTRAGGDYGLVDAYVVARGFDDDLVAHATEKRERNYVIPRRPYETRRWGGLTLVQYEAVPGRPAIRLTTVLPPR